MNVRPFGWRAGPSLGPGNGREGFWSVPGPARCSGGNGHTDRRTAARVAARQGRFLTFVSRPTAGAYYSNGYSDAPWTMTDCDVVLRTRERLNCAVARGQTDLG